MRMRELEESPPPIDSPPLPDTVEVTPSSPSHLQQFTSPPTLSTLAFLAVCLAISIVELSIQLGLILVSAASSALTSDAMPTTTAPIIDELSAGNSRSPSPSPSPSTLIIPSGVNELRVYRPPYISIHQLQNLFPCSETPSTPWSAAQKIASEEVDLYDEHGDWDHGLDLQNLTQDDLEMDKDEEEEVMRTSDSQLTTSVAETFGISPLPTLPLVSTTTTTDVPLSYDIVCPRCRHVSSYSELINHWTLPDSPTIDNIGWYCSPDSPGTEWFKVAVGRRIGVFDNWPEARASISGISGATAYKCTSRAHALSKFHADLAGNRAVCYLDA